MVVKDAVPGKVWSEMTVEKHQTNRLSVPSSLSSLSHSEERCWWRGKENKQSLHGGVIASLVDTMGSLSLSSRGLWKTGVSTDLNVTRVSSLHFSLW